ncbi:MAG: hypothetical protein IPH32_14980 [Bacteroidetes bacterium]|nr:hypothetical protein [Bacteroidota bacterium]
MLLKIKELMPHCCSTGVDVDCWFREKPLNILQILTISSIRLDVSYLHVFTCCERDNTEAIEMKGVVDYA